MPSLLVASLLFILGCCFPPCQARGADTNSILRSWLNAQTNLQTWSADFVQTRALKSLTTPLTATGHVWFATPNRFRWELRYPGQTIAVRTPRELLVIYPKLKKAERYPLDTAGGGNWRDALALLEAGFPRTEAALRAQFEILSVTASNQTYELTLRPNSSLAARMIPRLKLVFDSASLSLEGNELQFADGSSMRNEFKNARLNSPIDEALFTPEIPADYKVTEPLKAR